jgi:hypothetical protein
MARNDPLSLREVRQLSGSADTILLTATRNADLETPIGTFMRFDDSGPAFLLESVEGGERLGRYAFLGVGPRRQGSRCSRAQEAAHDGADAPDGRRRHSWCGRANPNGHGRAYPGWLRAAQGRPRRRRARLLVRAERARHSCPGGPRRRAARGDRTSIGVRQVLPTPARPPLRSVRRTSRDRPPGSSRLAIASRAARTKTPSNAATVGIRIFCRSGRASSTDPPSAARLVPGSYCRAPRDA